MLLGVAEIVSSSHLQINSATTLFKCSHTKGLGRSATEKCQEILESRYLL